MDPPADPHPPAPAGAAAVPPWRPPAGWILEKQAVDEMSDDDLINHARKGIVQAIVAISEILSRLGPMDDITDDNNLNAEPARVALELLPSQWNTLNKLTRLKELIVPSDDDEDDGDGKDPAMEVEHRMAV